MSKDPLSAARAVALETEFDALLDDREAIHVDAMVTKYRSGKATFEALIGHVAVISELRKIRDTLTSEAQKAIQLLEEP